MLYKTINEPIKKFAPSCSCDKYIFSKKAIGFVYFGDVYSIINKQIYSHQTALVKKRCWTYDIPEYIK